VAGDGAAGGGAGEMARAAAFFLGAMFGVWVGGGVVWMWWFGVGGW
jgi:hypothetical protein